MKSQWRGFKSILADDIRDYLQHKRALGRKFETEESALRLFDRYLDEQHVATIATITLPLVEAFLATRPRRKARSYNHLLGVIRCFFNWLVVQERLQDSPVRIRMACSTGETKILPSPILSVLAALMIASTAPST